MCSNAWGYDILIFAISFQKSSIGYSLQHKRYQIPVKIWIFDDLFHKKGQVLVILITQPSGSASDEIGM